MSKSGTSVPSASTQRVVAVCVCVCQAEDRGGWWVTNEVLAAQSWHRMNWQVGLGCLIGQLLTSALDCSCFGYVRQVRLVQHCPPPRREWQEGGGLPCCAMFCFAWGHAFA